MSLLNLDRLVLSPLTETDFSDIHDMNCFPEVAKYNTIGIPKDLSETTAMLQRVLDKETSLMWALRNKDSGEFIGAFGMNLSAPRYHKGEIHYSLHPDFWRQGFALEAAKGVINYGFSQLDLHRIEAGVAVENVKSVTLLERVRMRREGTCRKILPLETGWMDNYMYAILDTDARDY